MVRDPFQTVFDAEHKTQLLAMNWKFVSFQDGTKNNRVLQENFQEELTASQSPAGDTVKEHPLQPLSMELCGNEEDKIFL